MHVRVRAVHLAWQVFAAMGWLLLQFGDQRFHLGNLADLRFDDAVGQFSHLRIKDMRPLAGQDSNRMVRDHRLHITYVVNRRLSSREACARIDCGSASYIKSQSGTHRACAAFD